MKTFSNGKKYNRWNVLTAIILMLFSLGPVYAWSVFGSALGQIWGTSYTTKISFIYTVSIAAYTIFGIISARLSKKIKPKGILIIAALLIFLGFEVLGFAFRPDTPISSLILLYIFYGIVFGAGAGFAYNLSLGLIAKNFADKAGFATGLALFGFGIGSYAVGQIVQKLLLGGYSLNFVFQVLGFGITAIVLTCAFIIQIPDQPIVATKPSQITPNPKSYTVSEALSTKSFWINFIWLILITIGAMIVMGSATNITKLYFNISFDDIAPQNVVLIALLVTIGNAFGRPIGGALLDKMGRAFLQYFICICTLSSGILFLVSYESQIISLLVLALIAIGLGFGCLAATSPVTLKFFGAAYYTDIVGISLLQMIPAVTIGPTAASMLFTSTGSYKASFLVITFVSIIGIALNVILGKTARTENLE